MRNRYFFYNMPTIGMVNGIRVILYAVDHPRPHVHLWKGDVQVRVDILNPRIRAGTFSAADRKAAIQWIRVHQPELLGNWVLASMGRAMRKIK